MSDGAAASRPPASRSSTSARPRRCSHEHRSTAGNTRWPRSPDTSATPPRTAGRSGPSWPPCAITGLVSGRGESLEITSVGRRIAVPETEEERLAALQEAFANKAFGPLYQESVKGSPISIHSIGRRAVNRLGVAPGSQGQFGEVFARSAAAAGLAETAGEGKITLATKPQARASDGENPGLADRRPAG